MIFVTGATGGIGLTLAKLVIKENSICVAVIRNPDKLLRAFYEDDISNLYAINYSMQPLDIFPCKKDFFQASDSDGAVTLILNAFDIAPIKKAIFYTDEEIHNNIQFNIIKQIEIIKKIYDYSKRMELPMRIVQLDSGAAYQPIVGWGLYCAGKSYINMFLKVFCLENEIPFVLYDPGVVDTNMQNYIRSIDKSQFPMVDTFRNYHLSGQLHFPEDVAQDIFSRYIKTWTAAQMQEKYREL